MSEKETGDPIEQAKKLLDVKRGDDPSVDVLLNNLLNLKNACHPDRFRHSKDKKDGKDRFILAQSLIEELKIIREKQLAQVPTRDIVKMSDSNNLLDLRLQLNVALIEVDNLKEQKEECEIRYTGLEKNILEERSARRDNELKNIKKQYEPRKDWLIGASVTVLLPFLLAILSQVEKVADYLERIYPGAPTITRIVLFGLCLLMLVGTLMK